MKVAVIGRTEILYNTALLLLENNYHIPLIVTAKEAPEYTKTAKDFEELSNRIKAKFIYTPKINHHLHEIKTLGPIDIAVSVNYPTIISQQIIDSFKLGILNAHAGDLPKYRGNACIAWAIMNGEKKIGITIHKMAGGKLDSGPIILKKYFNITINTKITEVIEYIREVVPKMFLEAIKKLEKNPTYILEVQDEKKAIRCYPLLPKDGKIDWNKTNIEIIRLINAFNKPYSGAFCFLNGEKMIIWEAQIYKSNEKYYAIPGQVAEILPTQEIVVITGKGKIKINQIEYKNYLGKPGVIIRSIRTRLE